MWQGNFMGLGGVVLSALSAMAWATADGPDYYAVTRVAGMDSLNLRGAPDAQARVLTTIAFNAVNVQNLGERQGTWCKVGYNGHRGWAACAHLTESDGQHYYGTQGYNDALNIRRSPRMSAAIVGTIPPLETGIQGTGECTRDWCPIDYQGKRGWVGRRYLASWSF